ncbi:pyridoxal-phosphate dependent enzyme, partial [Patescibacteria group bacterium]|nr:pyridoxal-phosphate dependent enzyme [Patescibacteria group bacterium]
PNVYFKREDENPTGSLKNRSLAYQVSLAKQNGKKELVISTSGNAGISAAAYCRKAGIKLYIFISPETEKAKIAEMQKYNPVIIKSKKAIRLANYLSAKYKIKNLRPSADDDSIEGFKSVVFEIFEELGEIGALFTFVTSGSSFAGMGRACKYLYENKEIEKMPRLFAVQSGDIFSVVGEFNNFKHTPSPSQEGNIAELFLTSVSNYRKENNAGRMGVKNTRRKKEILDLIKSSGGSGIYVNNKEIESAKDILNQNKIYTSTEGCASFAGVLKINKENKFKKVVCVLSGKARGEIGEIEESRIYKAENFDEVDEIINLKIKNQNAK